MILRVLGEGQFEVPDAALEELNRNDEVLVRAIDAGDQAAFTAALSGLLEAVRRAGSPLPEDHLGPSDYVIPSSDASLDEVRALLGDEGLIPG